MNRSIKVNAHSFLYVVGIVAYVLYSIFATSTLAVRFNSINYFYSMLKGIVFICVIFKLFFISKKIRHTILYVFLMAIVCSFVYVVTDSNRIMYFLVFLFLAYNVDDKIIVKSTLNSLIVSVSVVVFLALSGVIENHIYSREILSTGSVSYCMGFDYYSYLPMYVLFGCVMFSYLKEKLKIYNYLVMFSLMLVVHFCCRKRLTLIIGIFFLVGHYLFVNKRRVDLSKKWKKNFYTIFPELMFLLIVYLTLNFGNVGSPIDVLFNGRLKYGKLAFMRYPISLFGNEILMYGGSADLSLYEYFYIDSGYIYSLLGYGVIFTVLLLLALSFLMRYSCEINDRALWWWLIIVLIYNILGDVFLTITYNPILIVLFSIIVKQKKYGRRVSKYD